ncbi:hypothetical protein ACUDOC_29435 [Pseudomonas aeruginosa]|uniref:hypothetical protein n=1 Tax=Pseudomonas aeruginosa TaxID=287 RepID=UPI002149649B|nr:hypothetical protein [Pseudomonas aeruginosa]MCQ9839222.1 hypothetical protein [Pseudomonas aeruginosa]MCQ9867306.1 hypothetical protein [Pseudomonas aeruginosa]MCS8054802.1 hypothetical protein [Pseudomonas aeruginosa]MCT0837266.1 hypothetical protein [Pseudomonas aeruginosa]
MALDINISGPYQRTLPGGQTLTFARGYDFDGVWMRYWETHAADSPYRIDNLTYDEYEEYRQQHPELNMPELKPPPPATNPQGNTQGRVNGETPATGKSAEASRTTVESETPAEDDTGTKILDGLQTTLDVAGLIPGVGEIADLANAGISLARGDYAGAALSLVSAIPFAGWFGTAGKVGRRAANEAAERAAKETAEEAAEHGGKVLKRKLEPGTPEHKADRWQKYQDRGGQKDYDSWSKQYDTNMRNYQHGAAREAAYREAMGATEGTLKTPLTNRQIDILKKDEMYAGQLKTGPVSLTKENALAIAKDAELVKRGWKVEHILEKGASKPYLDALKNAGIDHKLAPQIP